mmetsp:Transcript_21528/g.52011  ORF Transcript_21528/g.52011 Transcript_21528/m.52011 type:complete len:216 (-) Transcript_21528:101-748(-)
MAAAGARRGRRRIRATEGPGGRALRIHDAVTTSPRILAGCIVPSRRLPSVTSTTAMEAVIMEDQQQQRQQQRTAARERGRRNASASGANSTAVLWPAPCQKRRRRRPRPLPRRPPLGRIPILSTEEEGSARSGGIIPRAYSNAFARTTTVIPRCGTILVWWKNTSSRRRMTAARRSTLAGRARFATFATPTPPPMTSATHGTSGTRCRWCPQRRL